MDSLHSPTRARRRHPPGSGLGWGVPLFGKLCLGLTLLLVWGQNRSAAAETFVFRAADHQKDGVSFELDAPFAAIKAQAPGLEGELQIEDGRAKGRFRVRVDQIKTGIEGRDRDLQKPGWLDARRWPHIGFVFEGLEVPKEIMDGASHVLHVEGRLILHGIERVQPVELSVRYDEKEGRLHCEGSFAVRLEAHRIKQSDSSAKKLIGLSVGEVAKVRLRLVGRRG